MQSSIFVGDLPSTIADTINTNIGNIIIVASIAIINKRIFDIFFVLLLF